MSKYVIFRHNSTGTELPHIALIEKPNTHFQLTNFVEWCEQNCQDLFSYCRYSTSENGKRFSVNFHFKNNQDAVYFKITHG